MENLKWIVIKSNINSGGMDESFKVCESKECALEKAAETWDALSEFDRKKQTITVGLANIDEEGEYAELENGSIDADLREVAMTYGE